MLKLPSETTSSLHKRKNKEHNKEDVGVYRLPSLRLQHDDGLGVLSADVLHLRGLFLSLNQRKLKIIIAWQLNIKAT